MLLCEKFLYLILSHLIGNSAPVIALQIEPTPGCWHAGNRSLTSQSWVNWVGFIGCIQNNGHTIESLAENAKKMIVLAMSVEA